MALNGLLVIKMGIDQIGKKFVKSMSVKKFSYLGQFIWGLRTPEWNNFFTIDDLTEKNQCFVLQFIAIFSPPEMRS